MSQLDALNVVSKRYFLQSMQRWEWNENLQNVQFQGFTPLADQAALTAQIWGQIEGHWYAISHVVDKADLEVALGNTDTAFEFIERVIERMVREINEAAADSFELWVREVRREHANNPGEFQSE